jgi:hypothetical protein
MCETAQLLHMRLEHVLAVTQSCSKVWASPKSCLPSGPSKPTHITHSWAMSPTAH